MKTKLLRRLNNTYQKIYRSRHIKALELNQTDAEYRLHDLFIALYDWDKTHVETHGTVEATDRELSDLLNWSASKVCRTRVKLIKQGLIRKIRPHAYLVNHVASVQQENANLQDKNSLVQQQVAEVEQNQGYNTQNSIVSYKDKNNDLKSSLPEDDIEWINENVLSD